MICPKCKTECQIYKQINRSGSVVVVERCPYCKRNPAPQRAFLPKGEYDVEALPLFVDYSEEAEPCGVRGCENKGVEYHHFAPKHLFEDADDWVTGWLCKYHHDLWHKKTETGTYLRRTK